MISGLFVIPLVGALLGWLAAYLSLKLIFHPAEPVNLGFMKFQGILPGNREAIALVVGEYFQRSFKLEEILNQILADIDFQSELDPLLEDQLDNLVVALKQQIPMAAMFLSPPLIQKLKGLAKAEIIKLIPALKDKLAAKVIQKIDMKKMISEQLTGSTVAGFGKLLEDKVMLKRGRWGGFAASIGYLAGLLQVFLYWYFSS